MRFRALLGLLSCCAALAACGDSLTGSWSTAPIEFSSGTSGAGDGTYVVTCTFESGSKFEFENVATYAGGDGADGCIDTDRSNGTYEEADDTGDDVIDLTFLGGSKMTTGCADTTRNVPETMAPVESTSADVPGGGNAFAYKVDGDTLSLTLTYGTQAPSPRLFMKK